MVYPVHLARRLPQPPAVPFDSIEPHPLGFVMATCPICGSRCWIMGPGRTDYPCARCAPEGKWVASIKRTRTRKSKPAIRYGARHKHSRIGPSSISTGVLDIATSGTAPAPRPAVADYGTAPAGGLEEHPALNTLRAAYSTVTDALRLVEGDPKQFTTALSAARATIADVAKKLKGVG